MVFDSHIFLFGFLPLTLAVYFALPRRGRNGYLALAGWVFYGWAYPPFAVVLIAATLVDYVAGLLISGQGHPSAWKAPVAALDPHGPRGFLQRTGLALSLAVNAALLAGVRWFLADPGDGEAALKVLVPLGLGVHTLRSMSYAIDVYRGRAPAIRRFADLACCVALFPLLVAGPVARFAPVAGQFASRRETPALFARGVALFSVGLAEVVLLAGPLGRVADAVFASAGPCTADAWVGAAAFAFQILFQFSGTCDMAAGVGALFGFSLPANFDAPYRAVSITDFWRRWNVTLSDWLRACLGVAPDGGDARGPRGFASLAVAMLLIGLWHGAAWTLVVWAGIHAACLAIERLAGGSPLRALPRPLQVAATFAVLVVAWVFFRADDVGNAVRYCGSMLGLVPPADGARLLDGWIRSPYHAGAMALAAVVAWRGVPAVAWTRRLTAAKAVAAVALLAVSVVAMSIRPLTATVSCLFQGP